MSFWATATKAAYNAVAAPIPATIHGAQCQAAIASTGAVRTMRYTPAVTMVAAWMSAETGVGPSIASGSHRYKGNCALLPTAPTNSISAIIVAVDWAIPPWLAASFRGP